MFLKAIFVLVIFTSTAVARIYTEQRCSYSEFSCHDGTCVDLSLYCDGDRDCADGSDEATCYTGTSLDLPVLRRTKKQVLCRHLEWSCNDGHCIHQLRKCDGAVDCPDGSDETGELCATIRSLDLPVLRRTKKQVLCRHLEWSCNDGHCIHQLRKCDGAVDCPDGSDETGELCATISCDQSMFRCAYGACVADSAPCNGVTDCADNSDELLASCDNHTAVNDIGSNALWSWEEAASPKRSKRQAKPACRKSQWRCADGNCISIYGKCDGIKDCPDGSDETFALCRKTPLKSYKTPSGTVYKNLKQKLWKEQAANFTKPKKPIRCQSNWFRCTYGACVDGTAPCNNIQECADNSDELLRRCRNQTEDVRGTFTCDNGQEISAFAHCDGVKDCTDGSDETVKACAGQTCASHLFQCAYGACVDQGSDCNNKIDCADGSDETDELCNRTSTALITPPVIPSSGGACKLPPYPKHGGYRVSNVPNASPGQGYDSVGLNITCDPGYGVVGSRERVCFYGTWSPTVVTDCVRFCRLNKDNSVEYRCLLSGNQEGFRECEEYEPDGTIVKPECNKPSYYYAGVLSYMRCIDGSWDYVARCNADCGRVVPKGIDLIIGGRPAERGELPWHAGIYRKTTTPYMQICGGSLVSASVVISAAHCFWNDTHKALPAENYAVALGKLYRPWAYPKDKDVQRSDVAHIKLTPRFQGSTTNFQDDIALLLLSTVIQYLPHIRPVCTDFNIVFENRQLSAGNKGKVAGWGLSSENGVASQFLKVVELPYISIQECQTDAPLDFREYITGDKICAGYRNGTALCKGDSGGGLAFPESDRGVIRYYLRGIVSTAPNNDNLCNAYWLTTFTQISRHEHFINTYL